jgi:hypothetical protein
VSLNPVNVRSSIGGGACVDISGVRSGIPYSDCRSAFRESGVWNREPRIQTVAERQGV